MPYIIFKACLQIFWQFKLQNLTYEIKNVNKGNNYAYRALTGLK